VSAAVAIVGIGCRFPGGVTDPESLWALLRDGRFAVGEIPRDRMDLERFFDARPGTPGRMSTRWGGFLDGIDGLDADFFSLSPREAERLDPQQRLLLETGWEALEDAGQDARALEGSRTGVFVGQWLSDFEGRLFADPERIDFQMTTGSGRYASSGRLSYALGLRGPSLTLDTACSSSLVAVHLAVRALRAGDCDLALAGGANVLLQPHVTIAYSQSGMMAPDGKCKFGDARGDGYVRSEGAAVVVLKPLARAVADGDRVYAVIRGTAVNNDGRSSGSMGTPSRVGQEEVVRAALADAGVAPARVGYVEAHGTGTRSGDPGERAARAAALGAGRAPGARALVGSVKTNIGHTEGAAGVAGLIKAALALHHRAVPASLHFQTPNPAVPWAEVPLAIPTATTPWPAGENPRVAGVTALGIAGTNAHAVLEEYASLAGTSLAGTSLAGTSLAAGEARWVDASTSLAAGEARSDDAASPEHDHLRDRDRDQVQDQDQDQDQVQVQVQVQDQDQDNCAASPVRPAVLAISARSPEALRALAGRYADLLAAPGAPALADVCHAAATRRTALEHRAAFVAADAGAAVDALRRAAAGEAPPFAGTADGARARVAFVVPGQGGQWAGMARSLLATEPVFREAIARCDAAARRVADLSILAQLEAEPGSPAYRLDDIDVVQPVLVALAVGYAALLRSLGVEPDAVVGHSMGEVAAAHLAGALDLDQAMRVVCRRSALMRRTSGRGAMALVDLPAEEALAAIRGREEQLSVAVRNSPRSCVLSGEPAALDAVLAELEARQVFCRRVKVDVASHSPQMEPLAQELARELADLRPGEAAIPIVSTTLGRRAEGRELDSAHWAQNLRQPVRFEEAIRALAQDGVTAFVELGPHPVLLPSIEQTVRACGKTAALAAAGRREEPDAAVLLGAVAGLWAAGARVDWRAVLPPCPRPPVRLPLYPWQRERHWIEAAELVHGGPGEEAAPARERVRVDDEALSWLHALRWKGAEPGPATAGGAWLVVGPAALAEPVAAALRGAGARADAVGPADLAATLAARRGEDGALRGVATVAAAGAVADGGAVPYLPVATLQTVLAAGWRSPPRLWFVTRGAQAAGARAARVAVDEAALWGAARVVAEEHPELWGGLADLDPAADVAAGAPLLARHLLAADGEDQVALRDGRRLVLRLARAEAGAPPPPPRWRRDAAYLVTGGLGDIGLRVAADLAARGARRVVLLGRRPLPPREGWAGLDPKSLDGRRVAAVRDLEARGVAVHAAAVDVADEAQLAAFLGRWSAEAWPPIRGVFHAAGVFENHLAAGMTRAAFEAGLGGKLRGAQHLDRLLPGLEHLVLFSSTGGFLAQPGQANYAAANAGLDALAQDRRARGLPAVSVQWGVWRGLGLVADEAGQRNVALMASQGLHGFDPERGIALLGRLCAHPEATVSVLPLDAAAWARTGRGREASLTRDLVAQAGGAGAPGAAAALSSGTPAERRRAVEALVSEAVSRVLKIPAPRLDARKALGAMGLTSLLAMELRNRLEVALGRPLPATLAFNYPTIAALVEHLAGAAAATAAPGPAPAPAAERPAPSAPEALKGIAGLTDEEAARALRASRRRGGA
jgi:epothilone polyketide synthase E